MLQRITGATIEIENNVAPHIVRENIKHSSLRALPWLALLPEDKRDCLIVAGGPSLPNDLAEIAARQKAGAYVLALNGAAKFLNANRITPDALMVLDSRPENDTFLVCEVRAHCFLASQCDPCLFDVAPADITLFHIDIPDIGALVPGEREIQAIGGGSTIGLIALSLAYVRGFRKLHLYGYDSSVTDAHHAYAQPGNDADVPIEAQTGGRTFMAVPWMLVQVEQFQRLMPQLLDLGCEVTVHGQGLLPFVAWQMLTLPPTPEADKYRAMWDCPEYRNESPGERLAARFVEIAGVTRKDCLIEFGCGTGRGGKRVHELTGCGILQIDIADNARNEGIDFPFLVHDLSQPMPCDVWGTVGYCTDVMEHVPPDLVEAVIANAMRCVPRCLFQIALTPENFGSLIGETLHLTVKPFGWWQSLFIRMGFEVLHAEDEGDTAIFYITKK